MTECTTIGCDNEASAIIGVGIFEQVVCDIHIAGYTVRRRLA